MRTTKFLLLMFGLALLFSCRKEEDDESKITETENYLIGIWTKTKLERKNGTSTWVDVTKNCDLEDTEKFQSDKIYILNDPNRCEPGGLSTIKGTWKLKDNDKTIVLTYDIASGEYENSIESITNDKLVITHSTYSGSSVMYRTSYKK